MSKLLKEALADLRELVEDVTISSHPFTDAHVAETRRRAVEIGASLTGESYNKYMAVFQHAMSVVASVQERNLIPVVHETEAGRLTCVAGVISDVPRWQEELEALESSLASFGLDTKQDTSDSFVVKATTLRYTMGLTPKNVIAKKLPKSYNLMLRGSDFRAVDHAVRGTRIATLLNEGERVGLDRDDMMLLLDKLNDFDNDDAMSVRSGILSTIGIEEV
jgi:hypothetical protein